MHFALVNNKRSEAESGLNGICPGCMQPVIAKCGNQKIHHWAHKSKRSCDNWWEPETEWHRSWKNHFPYEWQEKIFTDQITRENHIADVYTEQGLVIEFQHSSIKPEERISRENFYQNMVWIVDGARLKNDYKRFLKGQDEFRSIPNMQGFFRCFFYKEYFPKNWIQSSVPVIFDFLGLEKTINSNDLREPLYCLFPQQIGNQAVLALLSRKTFIDAIINGNFLHFINIHINALNQIQQEQQKLQRQREQSHINSFISQRSRYSRRRFRF